MEKQAKIYVAGHKGLVGSAIKRALEREGYTSIIVRTHQELDLLDQHAVEEFFSHEQPVYVFLAAAKVGGIVANMAAPASFIYENVQIQNSIIHASYKHGVKKLLFLGTSCIYPRVCPQPMKEEYLLTGPLEPTNEAYALAKITGIKMCQYYDVQYQTDFVAVMPPNIYGYNDTFDLQRSHVIPALIRRFHEAKVANSPTVTLWGTGTARREFLFADDVAEACLFFMDNFKPSEEQVKKGEIFMNVAAGTDQTIAELAKVVASAVGYTGTIAWDTTKPDGMPQKLLDTTKMTTLGWRQKTSLEKGVALTYQWYLENQP